MYRTTSLNDVPAEERFAYWWEALGRSVLPLHASSEQAADFWADMESVDLGTVRLSRVRSMPYVARRTPQLIRRSDPDYFHLVLTLRGRGTLRQSEREVTAKAFDLMVYDTSLPFDISAIPDSAPGPRTGTLIRPGTADAIIAAVPREQLPLPTSAIRRVTARLLRGDAGTGAVFSSMLRQTMRQGAVLSPSEGERLAPVLVDLAAAVLAHDLETTSAPLPPIPRETMVLRVQTYIREHLGDSGLSPQAVADAHSISLRTLHRLFEPEDSTVTEWIRGERLERCRRDLADPLSAHRPIRAIITRWGFTDPANFTRAFRTAYGISPRDYREHHAPGQRTNASQAADKNTSTDPS